MFDLLGIAANALELTVAGSEVEFILRHSVSRRNELVFKIKDGTIQYFGDGAMFFFRLRGLRRRRNCEHQQTACDHPYSRSHNPPWFPNPCKAAVILLDSA